LEGGVTEIWKPFFSSIEPERERGREEREERRERKIERRQSV
jgi:hypothetical protein